MIYSCLIRVRIRGTERIDDFGMILEVLTRRFKRGAVEKDFPDLIMIDGGKGQLSMAVQAISSFKIHNLDVIAIAKDRTHFIDETPHYLGERFFIPDKREPILLNKNSSAVHLLMKIRDEAHRFAITYHRKLRSKMNRSSILDEIPGVGLKRKKMLLRHLGSIKRVKEATIEELSAVPLIDSKTAKRVYQFFSSGD